MFEIAGFCFSGSPPSPWAGSSPPTPTHNPSETVSTPPPMLCLTNAPTVRHPFDSIISTCNLINTTTEPSTRNFSAPCHYFSSIHRSQLCHHHLQPFLLRVRPPPHCKPLNIYPNLRLHHPQLCQPFLHPYLHPLQL